jgi:hypothetical protein
VEAFSSELKPWDTSGPTIRFPGKTSTSRIVRKEIVKATIEENEVRVKNTKT